MLTDRLYTMLSQWASLTLASLGDPPVSLKPREYKPYYLGLNEVHKSDAVSFLCWEVQLYSVFFFKNFSFRSQKQYLQSRQ